MIRRFLFLSVALLLASCNKQNVQYTSLYQDDGHRKPTIAFIPVIDHSDAEVPWSLSEEFTRSIKNRIASRAKIHFADDTDVMHIISQCDETCPPFSQDLSWMKKAFKDQQFIVFVELVDHYLHTHPHQRIAELEDNRTAFLDLTMRVRIADVRGEKPKVVLQELIHHNHPIPKLFANTDYKEKHWGKTSFNFTPMGLAHAQLVKEVCSRIEDYVSIAYTR